MTKFKKEDLSVGQKLWFSRTINRGRYGDDDFYVEITKIGNKWISFKKGYYRSETDRADYDGNVDGGQYSSPGQLWISKEAGQAEKDRQEAWGILQKKVHNMYYAPDGVTVEQIEAAHKALFGNDGN